MKLKQITTVAVLALIVVACWRQHSNIINEVKTDRQRRSVMRDLRDNYRNNPARPLVGGNTISTYINPDSIDRSKREFNTVRKFLSSRLKYPDTNRFDTVQHNIKYNREHAAKALVSAIDVDNDLCYRNILDQRFGGSRDRMIDEFLLNRESKAIEIRYDGGSLPEGHRNTRNQKIAPIWNYGIICPPNCPGDRNPNLFGYDVEGCR